MKTNKDMALLILDILEDRVDKLEARNNALYEEALLIGSKIAEVKNRSIEEDKEKVLRESNYRLIDIENQQEEIHKELEDNLNKLKRIGTRLIEL